MADKKISELTSITGANLNDADLIPVVDSSVSETKKITFGEFKEALDTATGFVRIDGDTMTGTLVVPTVDINGGTIDGTVIGGSTPAAITGTTVTGTSFVTTGDMTFGDSDKAIFGAGSDLQIYHDGTNSYVSDQGTGSLYLQGTSLFITDSDGNEFIRCSDQGSGGIVYLKNLGATKLATTATGIDVTGTVTADGLTVDGVGVISANSASDALRITQVGAGNALLVEDSANPDSTPFVVTAAGNVGIGTSSPIDRLEVSGNILSVVNGTSSVSARSGDNTNYSQLRLRQTATESRLESFAAGTGTFAPLTFTVNNAERMRITSTGSVGIGTDNPAAKLHTSLASSGAAAVSAVGLSGFFENSGASSIQVAAGTGNPAYLFLGDAADIDATRIAAQDGFTQISASGASDYMRFDTGGFTERMRIDASGNVGIGTTSPLQALDVEGSIRSAGNLSLAGQSTADQTVKVGNGRTGNGNSYVDLIGDTTYSGFGARFIRTGGANGTTQISHRGTGGLNIIAQEAAPITFATTNTERLRVTAAGILQSAGGAAFVGTVATGATQGAIMEYGSNANGSFIKFADGTMICELKTPTLTSSTAVGNMFTSAASTQTYPAAFTVTPTIGASSTRVTGSFGHFAGTTSNGASTVDVRLMTAVSGATGTVDLVAFGRWF